ncbi:MAG: hypothetical protein V3571_00890, partial [Pseudodesulfovibrio sp.]
NAQTPPREADQEVLEILRLCLQNDIVVSLSHDFKWQGGGWKWAEGVAKATSRIIFTRQRSQLESGPNETDGIL